MVGLDVEVDELDRCFGDGDRWVGCGDRWARMWAATGGLGAGQFYSFAWRND